MTPKKLGSDWELLITGVTSFTAQCQSRQEAEVLLAPSLPASTVAGIMLEKGAAADENNMTGDVSGGGNLYGRSYGGSSNVALISHT